MSNKDETAAFATLLTQDPTELRAQAAAGHESGRKMRFKHAMSQLRETHQLRAARRNVARLLTAARQRQGSTGENT